MFKGMGVILILLSVFVGLGTLAYGMYTDYQYDKIIGSHLDNAFEVNTPQRMIEEIEKAKIAMMSEGLTPESYGALIFKKPSNSMAFQYEYLDSIIERAKAVEEWRTKVQEDTKATEALGDVYEQKMDNLREFLNEGGRADWIAKDAWYIENHVILYLFGVVGVMLCVVMFLIGLAFLMEG